jgi:HEAT repeat protein
MIQPPEAIPAFRAGLKDAQAENRLLASAGLLKAAELRPEIVADLVEALRDPEVQVRANAARALGRIRPLTGSAIEPLVECAANADDGLRLNAALALRLAPPGVASAVFQQLLHDANPRLRLIATGWILDADPSNTEATVVLINALADPAARVRKAALELIATLGPRGAVFLDAVRQRTAVEVEPAVSDLLAELVETLEHPIAGGQQPSSDPIDVANEEQRPARE